MELLDITGCTITIDAIGTQEKIMDKIIEKQGHFCLQLKKNQKTACNDTALFFQDMEQNSPKAFQELSSHTEQTKDHGRVEKREYYTYSNLDIIRQILDPRWKHVKCIGMARLTRRVGEVTSTEVHYHLLDTETSAADYGKLARGHWAIENCLHWVLDIHFREDGSTANHGNAISNLTLLRKIAFNFTKLDPSMNKKTTKQKMIDFMTGPQLFINLVFSTIPSL